MCDLFDRLRTWQKVGLIILAIVIFISCFLIGFSVTVLSPLLWGLEYDENAVAIDKGKLYESGRYFTGLGFSYLEFPRTQQIVYFSDTIVEEKNTKEGAEDLEEAENENTAENEEGEEEETKQSTQFPTISVRTQEGLKIYLDLYLGFKLTTEEDKDTKAAQLYSIYSNFGTEWNKFINLVVNSVTRDVLMEYKALDIPKIRREIGTQLETALDDKLKGYFFDVVSFNIVNIQYPSSLENAITQTELVNQDLLAMQFKKESKLIEQQTALILANLDGELYLDNAQTEGSIHLISKGALSLIQERKIQKYAETMKHIQEELGFTDDGAVPNPLNAQQKVLQFLWIYSLNQNDSNQVIIETKQPI